MDLSAGQEEELRDWRAQQRRRLSEFTDYAQRATRQPYPTSIRLSYANPSEQMLATNTLFRRTLENWELPSEYDGIVTIRTLADYKATRDALDSRKTIRADRHRRANESLRHWIDNPSQRSRFLLAFADEFPTDAPEQASNVDAQIRTENITLLERSVDEPVNDIPISMRQYLAAYLVYTTQRATRGTEYEGRDFDPTQAVMSNREMDDMVRTLYVRMRALYNVNRAVFNDRERASMRDALLVIHREYNKTDKNLQIVNSRILDASAIIRRVFKSLRNRGVRPVVDIGPNGELPDL